MIDSTPANFSRIGPRSRGCPVAGIRFELFVIGYLLDLYVVSRQLRTFQWLPSHCLLKLLKVMRSATDVFAQKKFSKDVFISEICHR